jgi:hypothetical protein
LKNKITEQYQQRRPTYFLSQRTIKAQVVHETLADLRASIASSSVNIVHNIKEIPRKAHGFIKRTNHIEHHGWRHQSSFTVRPDTIELIKTRNGTNHRNALHRYNLS